MQVKEADRHCEGTVHHNAKCLLCPPLRFLCLAAIEVDEVDDLLVPVSRRCRLDRKISRYFNYISSISGILRCVAIKNQEI